jgi:hypothetical protein
MRILSFRTRAGVVRAAALGLVLLAGLAAVSRPAAAQMPDLRQMNGQALPSGELAAGSVSVRIFRQMMGNNVPDQAVELRTLAGAVVQTAKTDAQGRVVFTGLPLTTSYRAVAVVDGETLESQVIQLPQTGGIRVLLVAGLGAGASTAAGTPPAAAPATPAAPGTITLGSQSRIVFEQADESIEVFVLVDLVNGGSTPAALPQPIVFEIPEDGLGGAVLEESAGVGKLEGRRVVVSGPLAPGSTTLQFAYRLPSDSGRVAVRQVLPLPLPAGTVIVRKGAATNLTVSPERSRREMPIEGKPYLVVATGALAAGAPLEVAIDGLPSRARWPTYAAMALASLIVLVGAWYAFSPAETPQQERERLRRERSARFEELVRIERKLRGRGAGDEELIARRDTLIDEIGHFDALLGEPAAARTAERDRVRREQASSPVH